LTLHDHRISFDSPSIRSSTSTRLSRIPTTGDEGESSSSLAACFGTWMALRHLGPTSTHSPQGRLFVVCLGPRRRSEPSYLANPRTPRSRSLRTTSRAHKPVSLPCPV
jgi:hypothetical protein